MRRPFAGRRCQARALRSPVVGVSRGTVFLLRRPFLVETGLYEPGTNRILVKAHIEEEGMDRRRAGLLIVLSAAGLVFWLMSCGDNGEGSPTGKPAPEAKPNLEELAQQYAQEGGGGKTEKRLLKLLDGRVLTEKEVMEVVRSARDRVGLSRASAPDTD